MNHIEHLIANGYLVIHQEDALDQLSPKSLSRPAGNHGAVAQEEKRNPALRGGDPRDGGVLRVAPRFGEESLSLMRLGGHPSRRLSRMLQSILRLGRLRLIVLCLLCLSQTCVGQQDTPLRLTWEDNLLRIHADYLPGGSVEIWYLEAFCRKGAHRRDWRKTVVPHTTRLVSQSEKQSFLELESEIEPGVIARHRIESGTDEVSFHISFNNPTQTHADIQWAQPCIRVGRLTGKGQQEYWKKCFFFTDKGLTFLDQISRSEEALYRGGQVYVPRGIDPEDVNPRPISPITPAQPIIGCVSQDDRWILATAWDHTQELFQGVITCIHSDFRVGGLAPGETKEVKGKIYILKNHLDSVLRRWNSDFRG